MHDARIYNPFCIRTPRRFEGPSVVLLRKARRRNRCLTFASIIAAAGIMLATSNLSTQFDQPAPKAGFCETPVAAVVCAPGEVRR